MRSPFVSVLLCTYRPGGFDVALSGLVGQDYEGEWEVVIVDELHAWREGHVAEWWSDAQIRQGVFARGPLRHLSSARSIYPRSSTVFARNDALVAARGELGIWLTDYCAVRPSFISDHVAVHAKHGFDRALLVNAAFFNVWPPRFAPEVAAVLPVERSDFSRWACHRTLFESPLDASAVWLLPLQNRTMVDGVWSRLQTGQDEASMRFCDGWVTPDHLFMKNESFWLDALRAAGGLDEAYAGLHKYDDADLGLRLSARGWRFYHSKRPAIRVVQVRTQVGFMGQPDDAEAQGVALLDEARGRVANGMTAPRETHPALRATVKP